MRGFEFPNGETWKQVNKRLTSFISDEILKKVLIKSNKNKNFLIITHGGAIMELFNVFNKVNDPKSKIEFGNWSKNTCVNKVTIEKKDNQKIKCSVLIRNCAKHIE